MDEDTPGTTPPEATAPSAWAGRVVAIGASAGGLEALQQLFDLLPPDTGAAFVVIQHLSPDHRSMMDTLLARHTAMPVRQAEHDMPLEPDAVHLIPPGKTMRLVGGRLQLAPKPLHELSLPIDIFFESLADEGGRRALAVVLSGTGSDGARGIVAVVQAGGLALVQDPASARFDGMPRSAQATGVADLVAPVDVLARHLVECLLRPDTAEAPPPSVLPEPVDALLARVRDRAGIDFTQYKPRTVLRRIERRVQVLHLPTLQAYVGYLDEHPDEAARLRSELLIPVTRFFRDAEVFDTLAEKVVAPLVAGGRDPIRVWVAACASGEEAYSMAMLFLEAFDRQGRALPLKIFATDVEPQALEAASLGVYAASIEADVSPARLQRFFVRKDAGWQVTPELRQVVLFARHDLLTDPPFTRLHLVSCRNALIYLQPDAQERALQRLMFSLLPQGHLLLGGSETPGALQRHFAVLHMRHKLFRLLHREGLVPNLGPVAWPPPARDRPPTALAAPVRLGAPVERGQQLLARAYVPPSVLVGRDRQLLHVYGDVRHLLGLADGQPTLDVLKLLPRELSWAAALLLRSVFAEGGVHRSQWLKLGAEERSARLVARALPGSEGQPIEAALLSVEEGTLHDVVVAGEGAPDPSQQVEALERELQAAQHTLQATIQELEASNEELQATNEELIASNEELQSTNEELQSVNEELYTVNSEYQEKVEILNSLNADLENVSRAAAIPTLFVDADLTLLRFTAEAGQLFKLRETDVGRSLEDFAHSLEYGELFDDLRRTLVERRVVEREVRTRDGRWWLARMQPYLAPVKGGARAVVTFFDIGSLKHGERLQEVLDSLAEHIAVLDDKATIVMVNEAWRRFAVEQGNPGLAGCGPGDNYLAACLPAAQASDGADARTARDAADGLRAVLSGRQASFTLQYPCHSPDRKRWFLMHAARVNSVDGGAVVSHVDVSRWLDGAGPEGDHEPK